ncbi:MAG TPA: AlpA family phage regulatory protein [Steroidobacteraceae bacterium]|jgi:predicted DNA-binding transcriptional regulator AlpA|nr:AlpA family phage regulatory protein [Steroidobacteraceae bacterium]
MKQQARAVAWNSAAVIAWMRARMAAAGADPAAITDEPVRFMRLPEVRERVGLSTATVYRLVAADKFPKPFAIDGRSCGA